MVLKVELATEADAQRSADIESVAYGPNPLSACLFPPAPPGPPADSTTTSPTTSTTTTTTTTTAATSDASTQSGLTPRAAQLVDMLQSDPTTCHWVKVVDDQVQDPAQAMISFSCWYIWDKASPVMGPQVWGPGTNPEACEAFFGEMRKRRNERFDGKPFMYLRLLHTHPDHKRRGAGSMLLKWGAEEADRLGLDSYLEASPEGKPLYEKAGFKSVDTLTVDLSPWGGPASHSTELMVRPVSK